MLDRLAPRTISALLFAASLTLLAACGGSDTSPDEPPAEEPVEETAQDNEANNDAEPAPTDGSPPADVAAPPADAVVTDSGLAYKILREGDGGPTPEPTDVVRVHYVGWTTDGEKFDSSYDRGEPAEFPLNEVIPGWTEGVSMMTVGEKRRLWIPEELAYQGQPGRPAGMLVFDVELLGIE